MARRRTYRMMADVEAGLRGLHLRFDVRRPGDGGSVKLGAFTIGTFEEQPIQLAKKYVKGELVFHCPFDGHAVATVGAGRREPLAVENVEFVPGRLGQAAKFSAKAKSLLKYAIRDNMDPVRGTVMMWVKRDWDFSLEKQPWRSLFAYPQPGGHWKNRRLRALSGSGGSAAPCVPISLIRTISTTRKCPATTDGSTSRSLGTRRACGSTRTVGWRKQG